MVSRGAHYAKHWVRFPDPLPEFMDKKTKGSIAEQKVILALIEKNIVESLPIGNNDPYDMI